MVEVEAPAAHSVVAALFLVANDVSKYRTPDRLPSSGQILKIERSEPSAKDVRAHFAKEALYNYIRRSLQASALEC